MRLIDADALVETFEKNARIAARFGSNAPAFRYLELAYAVNNAPTIDAVPVVRCKDCKYRKVSEYHYKDIGYRTTECTRGNEGVIGTCEDDGYCSDGERKAEP